MVGLAVNFALRAGMFAMLAEVFRAGPDDPRFAGKGIGPRFGAFAMPATMLLPAIWLWRRRQSGGGPAAYPIWIDNFFLSMIALDLWGNVFDLYDRYEHFDLIPHAHGTGVVTVVAAWLYRLPMTQAVGVATVGHVLLEAQEYASDRLFGLRNVRGALDSIGDLASGAVGSLVYAAAYRRFVRDAGREPGQAGRPGAASRAPAAGPLPG
jgi:hypothetical protein